MGNINYINNMGNIQNFPSNIFDQQQNKQMLNSNQMQNYGFNLGEEMNLNMNNPNYNNRILNKNNIINTSPIANTNMLNMSMTSNMLQNLNYNGPINKFKNNVQNNSMNLNNRISLSSQGTKNTIPNFNMNQMENLNNVFAQNRMGQQGIPIILNPLVNRQNISTPNIPHLNNNLLNNSLMSNMSNNSLLKNDQNNPQMLYNRDMNHNNKAYKYGGRKKDFNQEFNEDNDNKKRNIILNNKINESNKLRNKENIPGLNNDNINNKKNRRKPIFKVKIKNGKKIINIEINNNYNIESELKKKLNVDEKILFILQKKISKAIETTKEIFGKPMNIHSYKLMRKINNSIFDENRNHNEINSGFRRNNSERDYKTNISKDIRPDLSDIQNNEILSSSFKENLKGFFL